MMKGLLSILLVVTLISCHSKKSITSTVLSQEDKYMKSEFHFDDCENLNNFLKEIIITNKEDTTLKKNYFKIPFIKLPYKFTKNIFQEKCFIGMSVEELDDLLGERAVLIRADGKVVTSLNGWYPDWYYLECDGIKLAFDIKIHNGVVRQFRIGPHAINNTIPSKLKK